VGQSPLMVLTHCIRQQAGSYSIRVALMSLERRDSLWETSEVTRVWAAIRTNAVGQSPSMLLTHCIRQQAGSYSSRVALMSLERRDSLWETSEVTRAAKAVGQSPSMVLTHCIRQQAGSLSLPTLSN